MLRVIKHNIFKVWEQGYVMCIPSNGFVKKNFDNVMGAGIAKEVKNRLSHFPYKLGKEIKQKGNIPHFFEEERLISLPTKHNWFENSDLELIDKSCYYLKGLFEFLHPHVYEFKNGLVFIPYLPGIGNGKLTEKQVVPIMKKYFDWSKNFVFCKLEKQ